MAQFQKGHTRFPSRESEDQPAVDPQKPKQPFDNLGDAPTLFERGQQITRPVPELRRVNPPDIASLSWVLPKIAGLLGITEPSAAMKMRLWSGDQGYCLVMKGDAVGLAQAWREPDGDMLIWERFVFRRDGDDTMKDAVAIYEHFWRWGQSMGCREMRLAMDRPIPDHMISNVVGKLVPRPSIAIVITAPQT